MDSFFGELPAQKARLLALETQRKKNVMERWNIVIDDIGKAAKEGYFELATICQLDVIEELGRMGYTVEYARVNDFFTPTKVMIKW